MQQSILLRPLGFWEVICKYGHDGFYGTGNVIACFNFSGFLTEEDFYKAVKKIYEIYEILRVTIRENNFIPYFYGYNSLSDIESEIIDQENQRNDSDNITQDLKKKFEIEKSLWRIKWYRDNDHVNHRIHVVFHHAISDGLSACYFAKIFLNILNHPDSFFNYCRLDKNIELLIPQRHHWQEFLLEKRNIQEYQIDQWEYSEFSKMEERNTKCFSYELSEIETKNLIYQAKKNSTTVQGALNAAALMATQTVKPEIMKTYLHTPVNLRNYSENIISSEAIGCFISMVTTCHQMQNEENFWWLARNCKMELGLSIPKLGLCPHPFYFRDWDIEELTCLFEMPGSTKRRYFSGGCGISNLGIMDISSEVHNPFKLHQLNFATSRIMGDHPIFINVLTFNGKMQLLFCYCEPLLYQDVALSWTKIFLDIIKKQSFI